MLKVYYEITKDYQTYREGWKSHLPSWFSKLEFAELIFSSLYQDLRKILVVHLA
jgi:hypothetical protein